MSFLVNKLFIDECGVHDSPANVWTYCALYGEEKDIDAKHQKLKEEIIAIIPALRDMKEIKYSNLKGDKREIVVKLLTKYQFDFFITYCDRGILDYAGGLIKPDNIRMHMAQTAVLDVLEKRGKSVEVVILDRMPFSRKNMEKIIKNVRDRLGHKVDFHTVRSTIKPGLQIADILAGASREYYRFERHKEFFSQNKERTRAFTTSHMIIKLDHQEKMKKEDWTICFQI